MNSPTNTAERMRELLASERLSVTELAERIGVSRQRVSQLATRMGLKLPRKAAAPGALRQWTNQWGGARKLTSHFIGAAAEMAASADLMRRGFPVYRALSFVSAADLVVDIDGRLQRVQVRAARRRQNGALAYGQPAKPERHDILALVLPDGQVTYKPDLPGDR